jgi:hypothetical protein
LLAAGFLGGMVVNKGVSEEEILIDTIHLFFRFRHDGESRVTNFDLKDLPDS